MLKAAAFGTVGALIAVAITYLIGDAISGPLMVTPPGGDAPEEVLLGAALFATVVGAVAGLVLAALSKRFLSNPASAFVGICVLGLVAYGAMTFAAGEDLATGLWLNVMHVAAALPIVGLLGKEIKTA